MGDLNVREANLPLGLPLALGESRLVLERETATDPQPVQPSGMRPWLCCSEEGRRAPGWPRKPPPRHFLSILPARTGTGKEVLAHLAHAWSV